MCQSPSLVPLRTYTAFMGVTREREPQVLTHNIVSHGGRAKSFINKYVVQDVKNVNIIKSVQ